MTGRLVVVALWAITSTWVLATNCPAWVAGLFVAVTSFGFFAFRGLTQHTGDPDLDHLLRQERNRQQIRQTQEQR